jgi:hypothetical protein
MLGLIKADLASTGKPHLRDGTPSLFLNFRALNALLFEGSHFDLQIVTHEIKFVSTTLIGRVDCGFSRRQGENQPAMTCIHGFEAEDIAEKYAICLGILTVDNYVSTRDHLLLQQGSHREHYGTPLTCFDPRPLAAYPWGKLYGIPRRTMQQALSISAQLAKGEDGRLKVDVSRIGVSISPSSFTWVEPTTLPKALPTKTAPGTFSRKRLPEWGKMAVTPVRTSSPRIMVVCPTLIVCGAGVVLIPRLPLIKLILFSQVANGALLPFLLVFMLIFVNRKELMGEYTNSRLANVIAWGTSVIIIILTIAMILATSIGQ